MASQRPFAKEQWREEKERQAEETMNRAIEELQDRRPELTISRDPGTGTHSQQMEETGA